MKDKKSDAENALAPDDSAISSNDVQKELIQRGRVDIHTHQTAAKHLKKRCGCLKRSKLRKSD